MPIHIDEIQTDVQVQPEGAAAVPADEPAWLKLAQLRALTQQLITDDLRTSARGNED